MYEVYTDTIERMNKSYVDDDDLVESLDSSLTFSETGVELIMPKSLSSRGVTSRCVDMR